MEGRPGGAGGISGGGAGIPGGAGGIPGGAGGIPGGAGGIPGGAGGIPGGAGGIPGGIGGSFGFSSLIIRPPSYAAWRQSLHHRLAYNHCADIIISGIVIVEQTVG